MNPSVHTDDARFLELLERWLTGEFTRSDERELRALAAADDFRREAWEGFAALPGEQHEIQLERLRRHFHRPEGRRIPIGMWMAAAAVLLVLLVAVYFLPTFQPENAAPMAKTAEPALEQAAEPSSGVIEQEQDVAAVQSGKSAKEVPLAMERSKSMPGASGAGLGSVQDDAGDLAEENTDAEVVMTTPAPTRSTAARKSRAAQPEVIIDGKSIRKEEKSSAVSSAPQPAVPAKPDAYAVAEDTSVDELASAKEKSAKKSQSTTAAPSVGWDNFHLYVRANARLTDAARNNNVSGNVRLQFNVGPDGKPANVQVLRSLGYGCDEEAMKIIRMFEWAPPGLEPVIVEVPFVR